MADQQKCCGTCRWAEPPHEDSRLRYCEAPVPDSRAGHGRSAMSVDDGTTCPCYQPAMPAQQPQPQTETEDDGN